MRVLSIGLAMALIPQIAGAADDTRWAGKYFCKGQAAGGVSWEESRKRWEGTSFGNRSEFIISLTNAPADIRIDKPQILSDNGLGQYVIKRMDLGEPSAVGLNCIKNGDPTDFGESPVLVYPWGAIECDISLSTFQMNLTTMRFLESYDHGYVDGNDNNNNTPYVQVGTCTKID